MTSPRTAWSLDPNQRLGDPAWRRRHGWPVLIAVCTLGVGTAAWFALMSLRPGISERYKVWAWFWGAFTVVTYNVLGGAFFVPIADDPEQMGLVVIVWLLRLLSVVQAVVMNRALLGEQAVAEVRREAALLGAPTGGLRPGAAGTGSADTVGDPRPVMGLPPLAPTPPPGPLGPPVTTGGRVLDPAPYAPPMTGGSEPMTWHPNAPEPPAPGRRLDL